VILQNGLYHGNDSDRDEKVKCGGTVTSVYSRYQVSVARGQCRVWVDQAVYKQVVITHRVCNIKKRFLYHGNEVANYQTLAFLMFLPYGGTLDQIWLPSLAWRVWEFFKNALSRIFSCLITQHLCMYPTVCCVFRWQVKTLTYGRMVVVFTTNRKVYLHWPASGGCSVFISTQFTGNQKVFVLVQIICDEQRMNDDLVFAVYAKRTWSTLQARLESSTWTRAWTNKRDKKDCSNEQRPRPGWN
jgi:hypothetical protein